MEKLEESLRSVSDAAKSPVGTIELCRHNGLWQISCHCKKSL